MILIYVLIDFRGQIRHSGREGSWFAVHLCIQGHILGCSGCSLPAGRARRRSLGTAQVAQLQGGGIALLSRAALAFLWGHGTAPVSAHTGEAAACPESRPDGDRDTTPLCARPPLGRGSRNSPAPFPPTFFLHSSVVS